MPNNCPYNFAINTWPSPRCSLWCALLVPPEAILALPWCSYAAPSALWPGGPDRCPVFCDRRGDIQRSGF